MDEIIKLGLRVLTINDNYLLSNDVNERSITHKLAEHFTVFFQSWNVDCEYNKNLNGPKNIHINPEIFLHRMADFLDNEAITNNISSDYSFLRDTHVSLEDIRRLSADLRDPDNLIYDEEFELIAFVLREADEKKVTKPIYPDIIVHRRGTKENLAVIEVKKTSNRLRTARLYDLVKLHVLTTDTEYGYQHAYFIDVPTAVSIDPLIDFSVRPYRFNHTIRIVESLATPIK